MKKLLITTLFPLSLFGQSWSPFGGGTNASVTSMCLNDDSTELFVGGYFNTAGSQTADKLAVWSQGGWSDIGAELDYGVHALTYLGGNLYVGGEFLSAGGSAATRIAVHDNGTWSTFGIGLPASVNEIIWYNHKLIAGTLDGLFLWNASTSSWDDMGLTSSTHAVVTDLKIFQGELYAVGSFEQADGLIANGIAKWNGSNWSVIGSGANNVIDVIEVWNNELYIGGAFTAINGVNAGGIAKWNGTSTAAVGTGVPVVSVGWSNRVSAMEAVVDKLYIGGLFSSIDNVSANNVASYNGVNFQALGSGTNNHVYELKLFQNDLVAGGLFTQAGGQSAAYLAKWDNVLALTENDPVSVSVFPNPSLGKIELLSDTPIKNIRVLSVIGAVLKDMEADLTLTEIDLSELPDGTYYLSIEDMNGSRVVKPIQLLGK